MKSIIEKMVSFLDRILLSDRSEDLIWDSLIILAHAFLFFLLIIVIMN